LLPPLAPLCFAPTVRAFTQRARPRSDRFHAHPAESWIAVVRAAFLLPAGDASRRPPPRRRARYDATLTIAVDEPRACGDLRGDAMS
jgi:hypothetical protein